MALTTITHDAPFVARLAAYSRERFPLLRQGLLIVSYYSSNQFLAQALTRPGEPMRYTLGSLMGAIVLLCFFFHLRVFDEHKDFADDSRHYPDRVLQRGLITLRHLKVLGGIALALEFTLAALWWPAGKPAPLVAVAIAVGFSLLMLREFFVQAWLRGHMIVYALLHMLVMPLLAMIVLAFATGLYPWQAPGWFWLYAFVGFFVTFNWEISRKIRIPDDEIEGVDSYSRIFGTFGVAWVVLGIRVVDTAMVALVGWHLGLTVWFYAALVALFAVCCVGFAHYRMRPTRKTARRLETYAGMYIIAFDLILALALGRTNGVIWTLGVAE